MSNCLVLQGKNFIAIGADTASSILIDQKYRRIGVDAKKLYRFGNEIMFCSGKMELVELVTSNVSTKDNKIVLDYLTEFIKSLNIEKSDTYDLEILICGVENNKSYMHQISQYNNFEVKTITNNTNSCAIYSTGFNAKTMLDTAKNNYPLCQNVSDLFIKSFKDISSEEVGGYINMYLLQENQTTKCVDNYKVDDIETISVSRNDIHYVVADVLIGDLIFGKTLHINNGKDTLIMDENGLTITNDVNTIIFDPNNTELMRVTNNDKKIFYFNELGDLFIDGNIFGGSLHLENEMGTYVDIDPDKENIMEIGKRSSDESEEITDFADNWTYNQILEYTPVEESHSSYNAMVNTTKMTYGNGVYIIGCDSFMYEDIMYRLQATFFKSTDGITWKAVALSDELGYVYFSDVCYGNNLFVAIGGNRLIHYSSDGITWNSTKIDFDSTNIYYGNGMFICVEKSGQTHYSTDGMTWSSGGKIDAYTTDKYGDTIEVNASPKICYGNNRYIMLYNTDYNLLYYSEDGISWNIISNNETIGDIVYGNGKFLMLCKKYIGSDDNYCYIHYSDDGITWTSVNSMININMRGYKLAYSNNKFIIVGADTYYSKDGVAWLKSNSTNDYYVDYRGTSWVYFANNKFFADFGSYICYLEDCSSYSSGKIFYVTENGNAYFKGTVYADDGVFQGDIIARSLTLGENAEVNGKVIAGSGSMGGWEIDTDCLKSVNFDAMTTTNGIRLDSNGEIRSKGSWYSSATGDGTEGWFARLCSGKWIFGYYDSSQSDPFIPPAGTPYSDISVNGIYICSKNTILNNVANRYLFRADAANDVVYITSNSENPALTITNDGEGTCLEVRNNSSTYDNKALSLGVTVLNTDAEGNTSYGMGYITVFGEGVEGSAGRIIMRPDQNIKSTDTTNPANYTNSACGTKFYPWGEMSCNHLYVDETSTTSDAKLKTPIKLIDSDTALEFINGLKPREYRFKDGERLHMGFYAQEVSQLAKDLNLGDMAIYEAIMTKDGEDKEYYYDENTDDEHLHWSLKYNEFIAPMVSAIQGLSKENKELKEKMSELESRLEKLEKLLLEK